MSKTITITISDNQAAEIQGLCEHMRDEATFNDAVRKCLDQGITQLSYRYKRNATQWQVRKDEKQLLKTLLAEREARQRQQQVEDDEIVARD